MLGKKCLSGIRKSYTPLFPTLPKSNKKFDLFWGLEFGLKYCILRDFGASDAFLEPLIRLVVGVL